MTREKRALWSRLGSRLYDLDDETFDQVVKQLEALVEFDDLISSFDHQLMLRVGRPNKRYLA